MIPGRPAGFCPPRQRPEVADCRVRIGSGMETRSSCTCSSLRCGIDLSRQLPLVRQRMSQLLMASDLSGRDGVESEFLGPHTFMPPPNDIDTVLLPYTRFSRPQSHGQASGRSHRPGID